jgi:hypothetical protein
MQTKSRRLLGSNLLREKQENVWHVGININKSKRAQVDWYERRKNRRARRANLIPTGRNQRGLAALFSACLKKHTLSFRLGPRLFRCQHRPNEQQYLNI